jgi:hypothetical protein
MVAGTPHGGGDSAAWSDIAPCWASMSALCGGCCEGKSADAKPPAAARTRVVSGPYTGSERTDIVHQRPPKRLRGVV